MLSTIRINAAKKTSAPEFKWTDDELRILLHAWVQYKSQQEYCAVNWGKTVRNKYEAAREIFAERITFSNGLSFIQSRFKSPLFGLFSLGFSGSKFLINLQRQFRVRGTFSCS